jgi:acetyl esterase/lipase
MDATGSRHHSVAILCIVAVAAALLAGAPAPAGAVPGTPAGQRFLDPVFTATTTTPDLVYGTAQHLGETVDLMLDVHEPLGDTAERRPLMVWIHGGSFQHGGRDGPLERYMADEFARRGFVVASISYRLASGDIGLDINNAHADGQAAVAWLRSHADTFRIDPSRIVAAGMSAGAVTSLSLGLRPDVVADPTALDGPSHVDAVVSMAGNASPTWAQPGEPPLLMQHGVDDEVVLAGPAQAFCDAVVIAGVPCEFVSYESTETIEATHVGFLAYLPQINERTAVWLQDALDLDAWSPITFLDVAEDAPFHDDIAWMATTGLSTGYPGPRFEPTAVVTRQTMAAFLHRLSDHLGGPDDPRPDPGFVDVPVGAPFYDDIAWLAATGITTGSPGPAPGTVQFEPTAPVSRQAMAAFMQRLDLLLTGADPPAPDPGYLDVPASSPFHDDIAWLADAGITTGYPGPTFRPTQVVTRQAMAAFMHRLADHVTAG